MKTRTRDHQLVERVSRRLALFGGWVLAAGAVPLKDEIALPEMLAVELPKAQMTEIGPAESPLKELLQSAAAGPLRITHDRSRPLPIGGTLVTWTAWDGVPGESRPRMTRSAYVYVLPNGQTPVGLSGDDHATAGNQSAKVVRDRTGKIHIAWLDAARPERGYRIMYRRGVQDPSTGTVTWETAAIAVSDGRAESWGSYVAIDASENAIHFV